MARNEDLSGIAWRMNFAYLFVLLIFAGLLSRLWYLQCIHGSYYLNLSTNNRTRTIRTTPPRGMLYDRDDRVLVRNRPSFNVALMLEDIEDPKAVIEELAQISGRELSDLEEALKKRSRPFEPQVVLSDINREELARIKAQSFKFPGVIITAVPTRLYPFQSLASHLLGYCLLYTSPSPRD